MQWGRCRHTHSVIERAKEELEILEFRHPNKFNSLKLELKALISDFESHNNLLMNSTTSMSPASTQESSSRKKRKEAGGSVEGKVGIKRRCKTDAVLEKAQQCLQKIQNFKTSFCITS